MQLSPTDAAYIAGLIDGEGCIQLRKPFQNWNKVWGVVQISNTDKRLIDWLQETVREGRIRTPQRRSVAHRQLYLWTISIVPARTLLTQCLPYLRAKQAQAELFINATKFNIAESVRVLRILNKRGTNRFDETAVANFDPQTVRSLDMEELAYLSAIVDGEGSFVFCHKRYKDKIHKWITLTVANASRKLMEFLNGTGFGRICIKRPQSERHKPSYVWAVGQKQLRQLLPEMTLKIKAARGEVVSDFFSTARGSAQCELAVLNQRGNLWNPAFTRSL